MSQRVIACQVVGEYVTGDGVVIGSAGSHDEVIIELDFSRAGETWEGTTKTVTFTDALGLNPTNILLTANMLVNGTNDVYLVPIPDIIKAVSGRMGMTVSGVIIEGQTEVIRAATELSRFRILPNELVTWDGDDVPASAAEQLQAEIDEFLDDIAHLDDSVAAAAESETNAAASATASAGSAAQASTSETNAAGSATTAAGKATLAESWAVGGTGTRTGENTNNAKYWSDQAQAALTVDNTPTPGSSNPVTSGGVYTALSGKEDTLTFDDAPTYRSSNPVTSNGLFNALSQKLSSSVPVRGGEGTNAIIENVVGGIQSGTATGDYCHVEGLTTKATGDCSHAEGYRTIANHKSQHVFGERNIEDPSTADASSRGNYVEIVGNGTEWVGSSNARTLDWSGNEWVGGKLTMDNPGTGEKDAVSHGQMATALAGKQNNLTFDSAPVENSANPVTSGGIKLYVDRMVGDVLFIATYGTTTSAEIDAAYYAGGEVVVDKDNYRYELKYRSNSTLHIFSTQTGAVRREITCNNNVWSEQVFTLANVNSPALTGTPTAPTATAGTDTAQIATTAFVNAAVSAAIGTAIGGAY